MQLRTIKRQLSAACHFAYTRLALNYYMYYETSLEDSLLSNRLAPLNEAFHGLLGDFLEGTCDEGSLDILRKQVTDEMEAATAYTDAFQAYEYALNRLEGRFAPQLLGDAAGASHEEAMTVRIMDYITDPDEAATVNERIRSVLGQLPVRLTKQKFFALVEEGLSVYRGGSRESLDDMFYILRSEALLNTPEDMVTGYEELHSILEELRTADYKGMGAEQYRRLTDELKRAGHMLMDDTGELMLLMELVNDLYVLSVSRSYAMMEVSEEQTLKGILEAVLALFKAGKDETIPADVTESLTKLEGKQETYYGQWVENSLSMEELSGIGRQDGDGAKLYKVEILLSGSSFMSLDAPETDSGTAVDDVMLKLELDRFFVELAESFKGQPKVLVRAIMAKVLSSLPVFFNSLEEVQEYIKSSLESCTDYMEKAITMKLIGDMMKEDGFDRDDRG